MRVDIKSLRGPTRRTCRLEQPTGFEFAHQRRGCQPSRPHHPAIRADVSRQGHRGTRARSGYARSLGASRKARSCIFQQPGDHHRGGEDHERARGDLAPGGSARGRAGGASPGPEAGEHRGPDAAFAARRRQRGAVHRSRGEDGRRRCERARRGPRRAESRARDRGRLRHAGEGGGRVPQARHPGPGGRRRGPVPQLGDDGGPGPRRAVPRSRSSRRRPPPAVSPSSTSTTPFGRTSSTRTGCGCGTSGSRSAASSGSP